MRHNQQNAGLEALTADVLVLRGVIESGVHVRADAARELFEGHIDERARACAQAWTIIAELGSPPVALLEAFARALEADSRRERAIAAALAGPRLATRILLVLPFASMLVMTLLGFDCFGVLFGRPVGWVCCALAVVLVAVAGSWTSRLIAIARRTAVLPGFTLELAAVGVLSGVSTSRLIVLVERAEWFKSAQRARERTRIVEIASSSSRWGIPLERLLRAAALSERESARATTERLTAELAERVLLPVGLCVLPAFVLLVAVPAIVSTFSGTELVGTYISTPLI
jgi:tight adherence protein B